MTNLQIITEPSVHVLAVPTFMPHPKYHLPTNPSKDLGSPFKELQGTPSEQLIAHAGKGCYDAYGEDGRDIEKHIRTLVDSGHGSVLEHACISLFIEGISRGCSHEFVRHRAGFAYSQRSTRYVDESECAVVLEPYMAELYEQRLRLLDKTPRQFVSESIERYQLSEYLTSLENSIVDYKASVERLLTLAPPNLEKRDQRKWARGKARQLLPISIETRMTVTANLRAWRHFIIMRSSRYAEAEIRRLAEMIYYKLYNLAPSVFSDMALNCEKVDGFLEHNTNLKKV